MNLDFICMISLKLDFLIKILDVFFLNGFWPLSSDYRSVFNIEIELALVYIDECTSLDYLFLFTFHIGVVIYHLLKWILVWYGQIIMLIDVSFVNGIADSFWHLIQSWEYMNYKHKATTEPFVS